MRESRPHQAVPRAGDVASPRVVVISRAGAASLPVEVWDDLASRADVTTHACEQGPGEAEAAALLQDATVLAATNKCLPALTGSLLESCRNLRHVVLYATGYDHVEVDTLAEHGVTLSILPDYATAAVAEHGLAMLMAMTTRLHLAHDRCHGAAKPEASLRGVELGARTVGIIGVGRIGTHLAGLLGPLAGRVIGHDIDPVATERARAAGIPMADRDRLLAESDDVVLCASHRHGAPPIFGAPELSRLRPGSFVVNVARAALVDTEDALAAVAEGTIRGYAVDDEIIDPLRHRDLLTEGRVLQTAHSAWWRDEVLARGARMWGERILAAVDGAPRDVVEPGTGVVPGLVDPSTMSSGSPS